MQNLNFDCSFSDTLGHKLPFFLSFYFSHFFFPLFYCSEDQHLSQRVLLIYKRGFFRYIRYIAELEAKLQTTCCVSYYISIPTMSFVLLQPLSTRVLWNPTVHLVMGDLCLWLINLPPDGADIIPSISPLGTSF